MELCKPVKSRCKFASAAHPPRCNLREFSHELFPPVKVTVQSYIWEFAECEFSKTAQSNPPMNSAILCRPDVFVAYAAVLRQEDGFGERSSQVPD